MKTTIKDESSIYAIANECMTKIFKKMFGTTKAHFFNSYKLEQKENGFSIDPESYDVVKQISYEYWTCLGRCSWIDVEYID